MSIHHSFLISLAHWLHEGGIHREGLTFKGEGGGGGGNALLSTVPPSPQMKTLKSIGCNWSWTIIICKKNIGFNKDCNLTK
jgi:hypothetical protein